MFMVFLFGLIFPAAPAASSINILDRVPEIAWKDIQQGDLIGRGSFGDVYCGTWRGQHVAIKTLHVGVLTRDLIDNFNTETQLMWRCQFPNILKLHGICNEPGHCAMVFELMPRGSLYEFLHSQEEIQEKRRWQIAIDIAQGLVNLHENNVLHRDLKSHNILLDHHCRAKISDFGLAKLKLATSTTTANTQRHAVGTLRWRAPELLNPKPPKSNSAMDVYSYGMVLWELITRRFPFGDQDDDLIVVSAIKNGEREDIPDDCPHLWKEIIEACWQQQPESRPTITSILKRLKGELPNPFKPVWLPQEDPDPSAIKATGFVIYAASKEDWEKVLSYYWHHPVAGQDVARVEVIFSPEDNKGFSARMSKLQQRQDNPFYRPTWNEKPEAEWRMVINKKLETLAAPYHNDDCPDVKLLPLWHGTQTGNLGSILSAGYASFLCNSEGGYFGKGLYSTYEAAYAYQYASRTRSGAIPIPIDQRVLVLNWVTTFSSFSIINQDTQRNALTGEIELAVQIEPGKYDSHFIPIMGPEGRPIAPGETNQWTEFMVSDSAQILPRYLVTLQPSLPSQPNAPHSQVLAMFKALMTRLEDQEGRERGKLKEAVWQSYFGRSTAIIEIFKKLRVSEQYRIQLPMIASGCEIIYRRFYHGLLVYKKGEKDQVILPISELKNIGGQIDPLNGVFDLSDCGGADSFLSISTGYRKYDDLKNKNKVEIWFTPRFLIEKEIATVAKHLSNVFVSWDIFCPIGIFWTWGNWSKNRYDHLISERIEELSNKDLYSKWLELKIGNSIAKDTLPYSSSFHFFL